MMFFRILVILIPLSFFISCSGDEPQVEEKRLSGVVKEPGSISNADLIRNPASARGASADDVLPVITFDPVEYNFGTVQEGQIVEHVFQFTNTGDGPLIIARATSGCGCTVPAWPRAPIPPGETGEIKVRFDSNNRTGDRRQSITVEANTMPPQTNVFLVGNVIPGSAG